MKIEIANAMSGYIEILYEENQNLIKLCGIDIINDMEDSTKQLLDIIQNIPRLIPYLYDKKTGNLRLENKDGLLEFKQDIMYLEEEYNKILNDNYNFLDKSRMIRNSYEHKMHGIKYKSSGSGTMSIFDFTFTVDKAIIEDKEYKIKKVNVTVFAYEFIRLIKELNILFSKIVNEIKEYAYKNKKDDYLYYRRICRYEFTDFNKIYDSELLKIIGKSMKKF